MMTKIAKLAALAAVPLVVGVLAAQPALAFPMPGGSYLASCRGAHMEGPYLVAVCRGVYGVWHPTSILAPRCYGYGVSNQGGQLACGS